MEPVLFAVSLKGQSAEWITPWLRFLSPEKAERLGRMPAELASARRGATCPLCIRESVCVPAKELEFAVAPGGKPYVTKPSGLYFNISHSGNAVCLRGIQCPGWRRHPEDGSCPV